MMEEAPVGKEGYPAISRRETECPGCSGSIGFDEQCVWVSGEGIFHPDCVPEGVVVRPPVRGER
jgi:hypothetical protein